VFSSIDGLASGVLRILGDLRSIAGTVIRSGGTYGTFSTNRLYRVIEIGNVSHRAGENTNIMQ